LIGRFSGILICIVLVLFLGGILILAAQGARYRGKLTQCKMNLIYLGKMATQIYKSGFEINSRGRMFWQSLRDLYEKGREGYIIRHPDPYVCPVLGRTPTNYGDPDCIDYRGPSRDLASYGRDDPIACDRKDNHGKGMYGFVLFLDLSVEESYPRVTPYQAEQTLHNKIQQLTSD
jgi:hypothetical protein